MARLWAYGCLYDVRSPDFKNRDKKQVAIEEIATKLSFFPRFFKLKELLKALLVPSCRFACLRPPS